MRASIVMAVVLLAGCRSTPEAPLYDGPRVVSLHDVTTEMVVAFGATSSLVGIAELVDATPELAAAVRNVPRAGGLESIVALRPSLVLGLGVVEEQDPELVRHLRASGIDVVLADPVTLEDVLALARTVGEKVGASEKAEQRVAELARHVGLLKEAGRTSEAGAAEPAGHRPRVFVYDCCNPPFTAGGKTVLSDVIARAGGENIFADVAADWTHVSWEEVLARSPERIIVHAYRMEGQGDVPEKLRTLREIPSLSEVPVTVLPLGCALGGLRSVEGFDRLRAALAGRS